ncbi:hypothetical protein FHY02_004320 [Sphingomonas sp. BK069]|nr:hypothetical protein [Sphingomonas sp. BK069]
MKQPRRRLADKARSAPQDLPFRLTAERVPADDRDTPETSSKNLGDQGSMEDLGLQ